MNHVINDAASAFFESHPEYRAKNIGVIPETDPSGKKPPAAKLFIAFYELPS